MTTCWNWCVESSWLMILNEFRPTNKLTSKASCFIAYISCSQKYAHNINIHLPVLCFILWPNGWRLLKIKVKPVLRRITFWYRNDSSKEVPMHIRKFQCTRCNFVQDCAGVKEHRKKKKCQLCPSVRWSVQKTRVSKCPKMKFQTFVQIKDFFFWHSEIGYSYICIK